MRGEVAYIFAFDVASEIKTSRVRQILQTQPVPFTLRTDRTVPRSMAYYQPLTIELPLRPGLVDGRDLKIQVRVYEVGALSVILSVPFDVASLLDLLPLHDPTLRDGRSLDEVAATVQRQVVESIAPSLIRPTAPLDPETYTVFCLTDLGGQRDCEVWLEANRAEVAGLLAETPPERLSEAQITETMRIARSYERTDMVVIDWDAALLVDLTGYLEDSLYVLEMATIQLEEFKAVDSQLDRHLNRAYEDFEENRAGLFGRGRHSTLKALRHIRVDAMRLTDEVTHISKFFGDWYLARVYLGARNRFHLDHWKSSVQDRLAQLDQLYSVAQGETNERRMLVLECLIVVLFAIDIGALFFAGK